MNAMTTLDFESFWKWLITHPNCILRAGTPESVLYDDEDLHWHFAQENDGTLLVQTLRGKRLLAEFFLDGARIAYVQEVPDEDSDEHTFELVSEIGSDTYSTYFFVVTHGMEDEPSSAGRIH